MNLESKIRHLIEQADRIVETDDADEDYNNASDSELMKWAEQAGVEDSIVMDAEGGLVNRDVIIKILKTIKNNEEEMEESVIAEADEDTPEDEETTEEPAEEQPEEEQKDIRSELEALSDEELVAVAEKSDMEDAVEQNEEGELSNRDALIDALVEKEESSEEDSDEDSDEDSNEETPEEKADVTVVVVSPEHEADKDEEDEEIELEKEYLETLFAADSELSEEFKEKAAVIFEAAINQQAKKIKQKYKIKLDKLAADYKKKVDAIKKEQEEKLEEVKKESLTETVSLVDGYMTEAVNSWIEENSVQLERNVRTELTEQFIDGLKHLFEDHYIEVPEQKFDLVKAQEDKIRQLEEQAVRLKAQRSMALKEAAALKCESIIAAATDGLTDVQKAKFEKLVESVEFDSIEQLESKVKLIRESYFSDNKEPTQRRSRKPIVENIVETEQPDEPVKTSVDIYADLITKTIR